MRNMRQERIRKEDRKEERRLKKEAAAKSRKDDGIIRGPDGIICCIPLVKCSRIGHPLPQSLEEGIKLSCTNPDCLHTRHLVHQECFDSLEHGLMTILQNQGSARGWTDGHRKHNLWGKKGLSLVQRSLRCPCGKGQMKRDDEAWKQREALLEPPREKKDKKKNKPKANLPSLQFAKKGIPPPIDLKKAHELDTHFLSSHSPPPCDMFLEDRYGPLKITPPTRTRKITTNSLNSSVTSISKASGSTTVKKVIHKPIGFAPIKTPPKPSLDGPKVKPQPRVASIPPQPEINNNNNNHGESRTTEILSRTATTESLINQWQQDLSIDELDEEERDNGEKEDGLNLISTLERPMSPPNTTTSGISFESFSSNSFIDSFPTLRSMAVQTDETAFCKAVLQDPCLKMYIPNDFDHDSGFHSIACSPKIVAESYRSMSPDDPMTECIINGDRIITPPPGFGTDRFKTLSKSEETTVPMLTNIAPIPQDPVPIYSLFDGQTLGLGEEILRRIYTRTLINYDDLVEYNFKYN